MNIKDIKKEKIELQDRINELFLKFQKDTECVIDGVELYEYYRIPSDYPIDYKPKVRIRIPE